MFFSFFPSRPPKASTFWTRTWPMRNSETDHGWTNKDKEKILQVEESDNKDNNRCRGRTDGRTDTQKERQRTQENGKRIRMSQSRERRERDGGGTTSSRGLH